MLLALLSLFFFPKLQLYKLCVYLFFFIIIIELDFPKEGWRRSVSHLSANGETTPRVLTFNQRLTENFTSPSAAKHADTQMRRGKL